MKRVNFSNLKFNEALSIILLLLFSMAFLTACSKPKEPAYLSFSPYSNQQLQKTSARSFHDSELGLTAFIIDVKTINNKRVKQFDILDFDGQLDIEVPPNVALVVSGLGFVENQLKYEGQVLVNPVRPGKKRSANLILYDVENQNNEIQVDIAFDKESAANGRSKGVRFSRDNNYVLFFSDSTNLISEDANDTIDIFLKNLAAVGITDTENLHSNDLGILGISEQSKIVEGADISEDGVYVVFSSDAANLVPDDTNGVSDVFLKNTVTGAIERISVIDGEQKSTGSFNPQISDDGLFISYFHQSGESADTAAIFLYHRILKTRVILPITNAHYVLSGNGRWIVYQNLDSQLVMYNINEKSEFVIAEETLGYMFNITQNGDFVAFIPELAGNEYAKNQFYLFSRTERTTVKLSRTLSGGNISENLTQSSLPAVSGDGTYVAFSYDNTIYVRELRNQNFTKVIQGNDPFISKNGARIGYSRGDNLFFVDNPLYLERAVSGKASAPADLQITPIFGGFELTWQAAQDADYYRIYQTTTVNIASNRENTEFNAIIRETNETSILITDNLLNNTSYFFAVAAVNQQGEGALSNEVSALTEFDEIPPTVDLITSPATNAFTLSNQVNIKFSENIFPATVNDTSIQLSDSDNNLVSVSFSVSNEFVYLNSASPLLFGEEYTVNISSTITDIAGNQLESDFQDSFITWKPSDEGSLISPIILNEGRYQGMVYTGSSYYNFSVVGAEKDIYAFIVSNASNSNILTSSDASPHPLQSNTYLFRTFEASVSDISLTVNGSETPRGAIYSIDVIGIDNIDASLGGRLELATLSNIAPKANINLSNLSPNTAYVLDLSPFVTGQIEIRSLFGNSTFCQISSANQLCEFMTDTNGEIMLTISGISNFDGLLVAGTLHAVSEININPLATEFFDFLQTGESVNYYKITGLDTTQYVLNLLASESSSPSVDYEISTQHWANAKCSGTLTATEFEPCLFTPSSPGQTVYVRIFDNGIQPNTSIDLALLKAPDVSEFDSFMSEVLVEGFQFFAVSGLLPNTDYVVTLSSDEITNGFLATSNDVFLADPFCEEQQISFSVSCGLRSDKSGTVYFAFTGSSIQTLMHITLLEPGVSALTAEIAEIKPVSPTSSFVVMDVVPFTEYLVKVSNFLVDTSIDTSFLTPKLQVYNGSTLDSLVCETNDFTLEQLTCLVFATENTLRLEIDDGGTLHSPPIEWFAAADILVSEISYVNATDLLPRIDATASTPFTVYEINNVDVDIEVIITMTGFTDSTFSFALYGDTDLSIPLCSSIFIEIGPALQCSYLNSSFNSFYLLVDATYAVGGFYELDLFVPLAIDK